MPNIKKGKCWCENENIKIRKPKTGGNRETIIGQRQLINNEKRNIINNIK